jgi:hypothetical protein
MFLATVCRTALASCAVMVGPDSEMKVNDTPRSESVFAILPPPGQA